MKTSDMIMIAGAGVLAYYIMKRRNETSLPYEIIPAAEDDPATVVDKCELPLLNGKFRRGFLLQRGALLHRLSTSVNSGCTSPIEP